MSRTATVIEKRFYISSHGTFWKFPPRANDVGQFYFRLFSIYDKACPFWYSKVAISAYNDVDPVDKVSLTGIGRTFQEIIFVPSLDHGRVLLNMQKGESPTPWSNPATDLKRGRRKACSCSQILCLELQSCPLPFNYRSNDIWCTLYSVVYFGPLKYMLQRSKLDAGTKVRHQNRPTVLYHFFPLSFQ